jgi:hypothetical protein
VAARAAADANEATARSNADTALSNADAAETSARQAADTAEAAARSAADVLLIPLSQKAAPSGVADLGADGLLPTARTRARPTFAQLDVCGHSVAAAGGATRGWQNGYVDNLARMLGVEVLRDLAAGGAISCWPLQSGPTGVGGWGWVMAGQTGHLVAPGPAGFGAPYLPARHLGLVHITENDFAELGSQKPQPMQEALRALISWMRTAVVVDDTDAAWTYTGTWSTTALGGFGTGPTGSYHSTTTVGDKATLAVPADWPGPPCVLAIDFFIDPTTDVTATIKIDGAAGTDVRLQGSALCDTNVAGKHNVYCYRIKNLAAGAHTIEVSLKSQGAAGQTLFVNDARVEADPADGPIVIVPSSWRPADNYSLWATWPHGPSAGTDPATDAGLATWKTAEQAVVADFDSNVVYVDIDTVLGKNAAYFDPTDHTHPNPLGHSLIAQAIYDALRAADLLTERRSTRPAPLPPTNYTRVFGQAGSASLSNSWVQDSPALAWYRAPNGRMYLRGAVKSGSSGSAVITTFAPGERPLKDLTFHGFSSTNTLQRWRLQASTGNLSIISGGDTTRSELPEVSFMPGQ